MKKLISITILSLLILPVFSQNEKQAKEILDKVSEKTRNFSSINADFEFIMENAEVDLKETNKGNIIIQNNKYKLSLGDIEIFNDGQSQWTFMPEVEEVNISEVIDDDNNYMNPANIFTIYENGFSYNYVGTSLSGNNYVIELTPNEINEFSKVTLEITKNAYQIDKAIMDGTDGNTYIVNITTMQTEKKYPESTFLFDTTKHPSVNVVDLR